MAGGGVGRRQSDEDEGPGGQRPASAGWIPFWCGTSRQSTKAEMSATSPIDQAIPERLPLVDAFVRERLEPGYRIDVDATVMIQHQLGSIVPLTRVLISLGVDPKRLFWVDIPYSA